MQTETDGANENSPFNSLILAAERSFRAAADPRFACINFLWAVDHLSQNVGHVLGAFKHSRQELEACDGDEVGQELLKLFDIPPVEPIKDAIKKAYETVTGHPFKMPTKVTWDDKNDIVYHD